MGARTGILSPARQRVEGESHQIICGDCLDVLRGMERVDTLFADPPDNMGLAYQTYKDKLSDEQYIGLLETWLRSVRRPKAKTVWFSYNARGPSRSAHRLRKSRAVPHRGPKRNPASNFTFGSIAHHDLGNNHRPLLRLRWSDAPLLPDAIRVPSWRRERRQTGGPAVGCPAMFLTSPAWWATPSSARWPGHPTQLNEGLVERCIKLTTPAGG